MIAPGQIATQLKVRKSLRKASIVAEGKSYIKLYVMDAKPGAYQQSTMEKEAKISITET